MNRSVPIHTPLTKPPEMNNALTFGSVFAFLKLLALHTSEVAVAQLLRLLTPGKIFESEPSGRSVRFMLRLKVN